MVIFITAATILAFLLANRLLGLATAALGFLFIAFDPFITALSRLLHVDGLMSALMLLSLLSYLAYLYDGRRRGYLLISGLAAGLSWLTKSPAFFLLPFIGLVVLVESVLNGREQRQNMSTSSRRMVRQIWKSAVPALAWAAIAAATFIVLWPAMWVDPLNTLNHIFSQAAVYALEGHENITFFQGQIYAIGDSAWNFYPISYAWRTTPTVLIGLGLALLALILSRKLGISTNERRIMFYLVLYAALFMLMMTLGDKKFDRYLLPAHLAAALIAAFGWVSLAKYLSSLLSGRLSSSLRRTGAALLVGALLTVQLLPILQTYPYYLNYYNPLLGGIQKATGAMMVGWGEGLDLAAAYLNEQPSAEDLRVISWYGDGPLSFLFVGQTVGMDVDMSIDFLRDSDYVVLYVNQFARQLPSPEMLDYFEGLQPVHVVSIGEQEYARIYDMRQPASLSH